MELAYLYFKTFKSVGAIISKIEIANVNKRIILVLDIKMQNCKG